MRKVVDFRLMDWLTFVDHVIRSLLGWPLAVVVSVILLRKQLANIILELRNLVVKAGPVELTVVREISQATETVRQELVSPTTGAAPNEPSIRYPRPNPKLNALLKVLAPEAMNAPPAARTQLGISAYDLMEEWLRSEVERLPKAPDEAGIEDWLPVLAIKRRLLPQQMAKAWQRLYEIREALAALHSAKVELPGELSAKYVDAVRDFTEVISISTLPDGEESKLQRDAPQGS